ncbi:hypothetical protein [Methanopyrus sp.]
MRDREEVAPGVARGGAAEQRGSTVRVGGTLLAAREPRELAELVRWMCASGGTWRP